MLAALGIRYGSEEGTEFSTNVHKTLAIETGIQNSGLGLLLYFNFFNDLGLGGMALCIAFWGIWDIASGLGLAYYWSLKTVKTTA